MFHMKLLCNYCGQAHSATALCRANTGQMTRRRFLFLFGAGVAATVTAATLGIDLGHLADRALRYRDVPWKTDIHLAPNQWLIISDAKTIDAYWRLLEADPRYERRW